jgi:hypothetical protein
MKGDYILFDRMFIEIVFSESSVARQFATPSPKKEQLIFLSFMPEANAKSPGQA